MSIILVMLHHFLFWRAIHRIIIKDVDVEWRKVGIQIPAVLHLLLILDLLYVNRV